MIIIWSFYIEHKSSQWKKYHYHINQTYSFKSQTYIIYIYITLVSECWITPVERCLATMSIILC